MGKKRAPRPGRTARGPDPASSGPKPEWLRRVLARAGALAPGEVEAAVQAGRITLGGQRVRAPMTLVRPGDEVRLDGRRIELAPPTLVLAFHKPAGCLVTTRDPGGAATVFDLLLPQLPPELARYGWHAVGRLDKETTGLLLFTNDERFAAHATLPATHLPKRYVARVQGRPTAADLEPLRRGIALEDGPARAADATVRAPGVVALTITEGRNHQVKRMLGAVRFPVLSLHREAVGRLALDVPEGAWRRLGDEEIRGLLLFEPRPAGSA